MNETDKKHRIPFAAHAQGFKHTDKEDACYCVLVADELDDSNLEAILKGASDFLGEDVVYLNHLDAGDFIHGQVKIVYFGKESVYGDKETNPQQG